jgi:aryl-alcohol dehydrogenase-like predicted oxidoreductase
MNMLAGRMRHFKGLGARISELGFGAWGIGGDNVGTNTPIHAREALLAYLEAGGNFVDTAISYGDSETAIGKTLREFGQNAPVYIATKSKNGETADTIALIRRDVEKSLSNLRRDYVDIFYLHMPPAEEAVMDAALAECEKLRRKGKIRCIGVSVKGPAVTDDTVALGKRYVDTGMVDVVQLAYSMVRQKNIETIEYAERHEVAIVVRTSMESGFLTGKYAPGIRFPADDHRSRWNGSIDAILTAAREIETKYLPASYHSIGQLAVRFALAPPGVTSVVVGAKNAEQQRENTAMANLPSLDPGLRKNLIGTFGAFTEQCNPRE